MGWIRLIEECHIYIKILEHVKGNDTTYFSQQLMHEGLCENVPKKFIDEK